MDGESAIDEAPITGESVPKRKGKGAAVFAGTINKEGVLRVKVTTAASDNTIAPIVKLVEEAQESKAPTERFTNRFSTYYTPAVVAVAALAVVLPPLPMGQSWGEWVYKGLAILAIGCPCALVISTPAAIAASLSAGARRGLLIKGAILESVGTITAIAMDKTGTLTEGRPKVTDVVAIGRSERDVLSIAAVLETGSSHPLAVAILARAEANAVPVPPAADASAIAGRGIVGRVGGVSLFFGSQAAAADRGTVPAEDERRDLLLRRSCARHEAAKHRREAERLGEADELLPELGRHLGGGDCVHEGQRPGNLKAIVLWGRGRAGGRRGAAA